MKIKQPSWVLRSLATILAGIQGLTTIIPVAMFVSAVPRVHASTANTSEESSQPHTVIRHAPHQEPRSILPQFSSPPTAADFFSVQVFPVALVPVGNPTADENKALAEALTAYVQRTNSEDQSILVNFLQQHPASAWKPALLVNLGILWRQTGYFSRARDAWKEAWNLSKHATGYKSKALADRAIGELTQFYAWIGGYDQLKPLLSELGDRKLTGGAAEMLADSRDGLAIMNNMPGSGFLCGPYALQQILAATQPGARSTVLVDAKSTRQGISLAQLKDLSDQAGLHLQIAKRISGDILTNSVVHWKLNHYGAVLKEVKGRYLVRDATFSQLYGREMWISKAALEEESDGYYLIRSGALPKGWHTVSVEEGQGIWGKGSVGARSNDPNCKSCDGNGGDGEDGSEDSDGSSSADYAMAGYQMTLMMVGLSVTDTPLRYKPPVGPQVAFKLAYNQRDPNSQAAPNYSNLGAQWTFNWFTCISDYGSNVAPTTVTRYANGGEQITHTVSNSITGTYFPDRDGATLQYNIWDGSSGDTYTLTFPNGSKQVFGYPSALAGGVRQMYLTAQYDAAGNALRFYYDSHGRLYEVDDAIGQPTKLYYDLASDIYKITRVEDDFGRVAHFQYDQDGRLQKITDEIGITSAFTYDAGSFITELTTPYGVTTFNYGDGGIDGSRWLYLTNPNGDHEYLYSPGLADDTTSIANDSTDSAQPSAVGGAAFSLNGFRNTFYFGKAALSLGTTNDFANATVYHWLHDNESGGSPVESGIMESMRRPLESRIYYWYPGQAAGTFSAGITLRKPCIIARLVDNPINPTSPLTQAYQYTYNNSGRLTQFIDPIGRATTLHYYSNGIDLQNVQQTNNGSSDMLGQFGTYSSQHRPATYTKADGTVYTFQWNSLGQLTNVINPRSETVAYIHDSSGYLKSILRSGDGLSATNFYGYDFCGRPNAFTNVAGYYVTAAYDNLNRITNVTYPDGTFEKYVYDKLNLFAAYDRAGNRTVWTYDGVGRPLTMRDRLNRLTQYGWCGCGSLESITDPLGHTTTWTRDVEGRVTQKTYQDSTSIQYAYEAFSGRLTSVTDAESQVKNYTYNLDNTLSNLTYSSAIISTPSVTFTYDTNYNRVLTMTDGAGVTSYGYYPVGVWGANQLMAETNSFANAIITYQYDNLGSVTNRAIDGVNESVAFDGLDRLTNHVTALGSFGSSYVGSTRQLDTFAYPNDLQTVYSYSSVVENNRLTNAVVSNLNPDLLSMGSGAFVDFENAYSFDKLGKIVGHTSSESFSEGSDFPPIHAFSINTFWYDSEGQLTDAIDQYIPGYPGYAFSYNYDAAGNRTRQQTEIIGSSIIVSQSSYNSVNQLTARSGAGPLPVRFLGTVDKYSTITVTNQYANLLDTNFTFGATVSLPVGASMVPVMAVDVNGNIASNNYAVTVAGDLNKTYRYDPDGNCTNVSMTDTNISYEWDAQNRLHAINIYFTNTSTLQRSEFAYDGSDRRSQIVEKINGSVVGTKRFVWCDSQLCQERDGSDAVTKRFFDEGEQIAGDNYYYIRDRLGSIQQMVDSDGYIRADYDYDPYGNQTKMQGDMDADFGFAGYYLHAPSGLYLTWYRAYDSDSGRWLNRDPIGEWGGINLYDYVYNNPINKIDPLGLVDPNDGDDDGLPPEQSMKEQPSKCPGDYEKATPEEKLADIEKAQQRNPTAINRISKSEQNFKNDLKAQARGASTPPPAETPNPAPPVEAPPRYIRFINPATGETTYQEMGGEDGGDIFENGDVFDEF